MELEESENKISTKKFVRAISTQLRKKQMPFAINPSFTDMKEPFRNVICGAVCLEKDEV